MLKKYNITVKGVTYEVTVEEVPVNGIAPAVATPAAPAVAAKPAAAPESSDCRVTAPMPGTVLSVNVAVGQAVKSGDTLCVLEAMKMENTISAPKDGKVLAVHISKGADVSGGDLLFTIN